MARVDEVAVVRGTLTCVTSEGDLLRPVHVSANLHGEIWLSEPCMVIEDAKVDLMVEDFYIEVLRSHWTFMINAINEARAEKKLPPIIVVPCSEPRLKVIEMNQPRTAIPKGQGFQVS